MLSKINEAMVNMDTTSIVDLIDKGTVDVNYQIGIGFTPLFIAVCNGDFLSVAKLLEMGAKVNHFISNGSDDDKFTPLVLALHLMSRGAEEPASAEEKANLFKTVAVLLLYGADTSLITLSIFGDNYREVQHIMGEAQDLLKTNIDEHKLLMNQRLTFAMGRVNKAGNESPIKILPIEIVTKILGEAFEDPGTNMKAQIIKKLSETEITQLIQ